MAQTKEAEAKYKAEGLRRMTLRKAGRKEKRKEHKRLHGSGDSRCPDCGNAMSWCSSCEEWSQYCCEDYGTCQCS